MNSETVVIMEIIRMMEMSEKSQSLTSIYGPDVNLWVLWHAAACVTRFPDYALPVLRFAVVAHQRAQLIMHGRSDVADEMLLLVDGQMALREIWAMEYHPEQEI